jgi:hypothetical protein
MIYQKNFYYVYYSYEEWGRGYIGRRGCNCLPEEDTAYFGSFRDKTFKPTFKIIIEIYKTEREAIAAEIMLHNFYKVDINPYFANKAKQTSIGFTFPQTKESRKKLSEFRKTMTGEKSPMWGRKGKDNPNTGQKRTEESKRKMREAKLGRPSHRKGKKLCEEHRRKMSKAAKKRWANKKLLSNK